MKMISLKKNILFALSSILFTLIIGQTLNYSQLSRSLKLSTIKEDEPKDAGENSPYDIFVREKSKNEKFVAITIDDGWGGNIQGFLDVLKENRVKATFFMQGNEAEKQPELMKKIVEEGHLLANHSYDHPEFTTLTKDEILWELEEGRKAILEASGYDPYPYFRYPYGSNSTLSNQILAEQGWKSFYWTQNTWDWAFEEDTPEGREYIYQTAIQNAPQESIVLLHTHGGSSVGTLPDIIKWYRENGYSFVTVNQL